MDDSNLSQKLDDFSLEKIQKKMKDVKDELDKNNKKLTEEFSSRIVSEKVG